MIIHGYITLMGCIRLLLLLKSSVKKVFVFIAGFLLFLISAFRSINFGPDAIGYEASYLLLQYRSLSELWNNVLTNTGKDPFFDLFAKLISLTGVNYQIWVAIIAGLFCYSVTKLIRNYSNEPYISFIALISLGYFYFSLTGLRQTIALSFIILSYKYLRERRKFSFILLVLIGSLFHSSAIIFLIAYPLASMKVGWKHIVGVTIALILAYFFRGSVITLLSFFIKSGNYENYLSREVTLTISGFIIQFAIYLFCIFFKEDILKSDNSNLSLYNLLFLGIVFQVFAAVIAEFFRVSMYFSIFGIILIPKAIASIKDKNILAITYLLVFLALVLYIFWTGSFNDFRFYFQV